MDEAALAAFFKNLDRSLFISGGYKTFAGLDRPLPIGCGQTISQPTLVLEMTRLLAPEKDSRILEIGTGSGYQTCFLAEFGGQVYTVERFPEFTEQARERLSALGYANIVFTTGDGSEGLPREAPFDRIIVTAAAGTMPEALLGQLAAGGRMLIPVGDAGMQVLKLITKDQSGETDVRDIEFVRFVELKGRYGF
jgi:protein-L-isoaspartate(D-aspartate) O-methyltransferase